MDNDTFWARLEFRLPSVPALLDILNLPTIPPQIAPSSTRLRCSHPDAPFETPLDRDPDLYG
jgi:hypothetical protein